MALFMNLYYNTISRQNNMSENHKNGGTIMDNYPLVVADLDGTLLTDEKKVSKENLIAINKYREKGGMFTIATGRSQKTVLPLLEILNIDMPMILLNGGELFDPKKGVIYSNYVDETIFEQVIDLFIDSDFGIMTFYKDKIFIPDFKPAHELYLEKQRDVKLEQLEEIKKFNKVNKILLVGNVKKARDMLLSLEQKIKKDINFVQTDDVYMDVLPNNISKGEGLKNLCEFLKIPLKKVVAVGDQMNDLSMIKIAGYGVAMGNAKQEVKKWAKYTTKDNNNNGIAHLLYEIMEKYSPI